MIVRAPRPDRYLMVSNDLIRDQRMSRRARGLLIEILSRPDNWETNSADLAKIGKEGREALRTALNEIEAAGYMIRTKQQNEKGQWVTTTMVYDEPQAQQTEAQKADLGSSGPISSTEKKKQSRRTRSEGSDGSWITA